MADTLPHGFDANWYRKTYPDVDLSGLSAQEHYRLVGARLGRKPHAGTKSPKPVVPPATPPKPAKAKPAAAPAAPAPRTAAIIDRPANLNLSATETRIPSPKTAADPAERARGITVGGIFFGPAADPGALRTPLSAYAAMMGLEARLPADIAVADLCCSHLVRQGVIQIENAWFADAGTLRLQLAEGRGAGCTLRAYQAPLSQPDALQELGPGICLPDQGPAFWDLPLLNTLSPLLMEISGPAVESCGVLLLPFPSLLPGGIHAGELKALLAAPNPMEAFWTLSQRFLSQLLDAGVSGRAITTLEADLAGVSGSEPLFRQDVLCWLAAVFSLAPAPVLPGAPSEGETVLAARLQQYEDLPDTLTAKLKSTPGTQDGPTGQGLQLSLPAGGIPTIGALVAPHFDMHMLARKTGPFLVSDRGSLRPRWSVSLPPVSGATSGIPLLCNPAAGPQKDSGAVLPATGMSDPIAPLPIHMAILPRPEEPPHITRLMMPVAPDARATGAVQGGLSILLTAEDPERCAAVLQSVQAQVTPGEPLDLAVRIDTPDPAVQAQIEKSLVALTEEQGATGSRIQSWRRLPADAEIAVEAATAEQPLVLTISDHVVLYDPSVLADLQKLLEKNPQAGSVSPLLLEETIVKKKVVLQPAAGGLFPGQLSFATAPRLGVIEPDPSQALPHHVYPVLANTFQMALLRRQAVADARDKARQTAQQDSVQATGHNTDLQLGLDLLDAGWHNLCSSQLRAGFTGAYPRRDAIDPISGSYMDIGRWERMFGSVTVLRELF
ncbi:hypothetical protein DD556_17325 [Phaeobacter sp. JL2872]|uniref:hypothetical protein n=1 Tax=Phaeobacter sp. JL2872 TaxID=2461377 RepID=UPI000D5EDA32|nr:hypothetical protein [Phaeobacter sp. JL2872]MEE2635257.1 hypothetical protein [Pseudomonadota bacterium]PVZ45241.1 hypothetical protein DD556_17325 [Phaeobacter sp. JL2872]